MKTAGTVQAVFPKPGTLSAPSFIEFYVLGDDGHSYEFLAGGRLATKLIKQAVPVGQKVIIEHDDHVIVSVELVQ